MEGISRYFIYLFTYMFTYLLIHFLPFTAFRFELNCKSFSLYVAKAYLNM